MEAEEGTNLKPRIRKNIFRVLKTTIKAVIIGVIYVLLLQVLAPASVMIPSLQEIVATFVIVYVVLMVVGDLTSGTIFQHFFNGAKSLFVIGYLIFSLNSGILDYTFGNVNLIIDVRLFLIVAMLLGLLGLAKSILQAINYVNEKVELTSV
jgi:uncharacterized ion transporter superfamily protein YfcC